MSEGDTERDKRETGGERGNDLPSLAALKVLVLFLILRLFFRSGKAESRK